MLDYPTCLKLKEAGFPQPSYSYRGPSGLAYNTTGRLMEYDTCCDFWHGDTRELTHVPLLEELIEACPKLYNGQVFDLCYLPNGVWTAWYEAPNEEIRPSKEGLGKTPIEAVANLWLALAKSN